MRETPQGSIEGQRCDKVECRLQMADALHASLGGTIEFVEQKHFPHGDADDLQILFPLKPLRRKTGPVSVDGKIIIQRKILKRPAKKK